MGFLEPLALLALPLALVPLLLAWHGRRSGTPVRFPSIYLLDQARRQPTRPVGRRSRWITALRVAAIALLVLAAARPVGPGRGGADTHLPTRALVAVDVSASVTQRWDGATAWEGLRAWADSILALASGDDEVALAAVADGVVGWWEGPPTGLRERLAALEPTARASDWPAVLAALEERLEDGTEAYLLTDGAAGRRAPDGAGAVRREAGLGRRKGHRGLRIWQAGQGPNRALVEARWMESERVVLAGRVWNGAPAAARVGRRVGVELVEPRVLSLDGRIGDAAWAVGDSATFALAEGDRLPADDRLFVARGAGGPYRVARWAPPDEPPDSGPLFWEAALSANGRGATVERVRRLDVLAGRPPALVLLPIRALRPDEARLLADLVEAGSRLLFVPPCPEPGCVPEGRWLPDGDLVAPALRWALGEPGWRAGLASAPGGGRPGHVPSHLTARAPTRGALEPADGAVPDWTWDLITGQPALWARGPVAVWLVPLGPPFTRLGATPIFPLVAQAVVSAIDPRWSGTGSIRPGDRMPVPEGGATVTGPLHRPDSMMWAVTAGSPAPRPERPGIYRVEAGEATFVAVNGDPAEGDLTPVPAAAWEQGWGVAPVSDAEWEGVLFPRRRGPELWPWAIVLALAALATEARFRRAGPHK